MRTPSCSQLAVDLPPVGRPIVGFLKAGETRRAVGRLALGLYGVGEQRRDERILYQIAEQLVEVILQLRASRIASSRIQRHLLADIIRYVHTCSALLPMLIQQLSGSHAHNIATMHYTVEIQATYYIPSGTHTHTVGTPSIQYRCQLNPHTWFNYIAHFITFHSQINFLVQMNQHLGHNGDAISVCLDAGRKPCTIL